MSYEVKPVWRVHVQVKLDRDLFVAADTAEEAQRILRTDEGWREAARDQDENVYLANQKKVEFFKPMRVEGWSREVWVDEEGSDDDDQEAARADR